MSKQIGAVYNSFVTDIDLNTQFTFVFLCGCNAMSDISQSPVLMENNTTEGVDMTFSLFIMTKIELYLENK